jgi:type I restriction enzyme S subunit
MIDALKPYPAYKDTKLPWLGTIPSHWEIRRNGRLFAQRNETGFPDLPILEVSLKTGVRVRNFDTSNRKQVMSDRDKYKCARRGDIAYNMMRLWQGAVGAAPVDGLVSPAYVVARPLPGTQTRYYEYAFRTDAYMNEVNRFSRGIVSDRNRLYWEDFKQMPSLLPPPTEQALIARFLDHLDRRVRRCIRAKRRMIDLLSERKQAIIHRAVTRGLDANVHLKPSGIQWLSEIPERWIATTFGRFIIGIDQGWSPVAAEGELQDEQWAVLTLSCMRKGSFRPDAIKPISLQAFVPARMTVSDGDLLMSRSNTRQLVGDCCIVEDARPLTILCDLIYRLRLQTTRLNSRFALFWLLSPAARRQIEADARGSSSTMVKLSHGHIRRWQIAVPDLQTQHGIVEYVIAALLPIDQAVNRAHREIDLLREYRTRLIADVVTGKLDVRAAAAKLPEEADEPEALDNADALADGDDFADDLDAVPEEAEL